tara:strand:+ start:2299 stop:3459 length:1161 start_codon:yes stop_codon:yes gene_type:complete
MKIAVLGAGTVGVMSVCHFLRYTNANVTCIFNPNKKILGVGESSNIQLPHLLWESINFNPVLQKEKLDCTLKYSVFYKDWREKNFHSPIIPNSYALHFNNFKLQSFVFNECQKIYKDRFKILEENISSVNASETEVKVNNYKFDYVIDCCGWPESYEDYHVSTSLPLNKALVYPIDKPGDWNFTYHYAHKNGWMFGIPLSSRQGWGYLFNDKITTDIEAIEDLQKILKQKINENQLNEFKFKPYRSKKLLNKRIIKNGNRAIFYEPLEALSGVVYDNINRLFFDFIRNNKSENQVNHEFDILSQAYENFINFIYHGGSIHNTIFWKETKEMTNKHLLNNLIWESAKIYINLNNRGRDVFNYNINIFPFVPYLWNILHKNLGYKYFT